MDNLGETFINLKPFFSDSTGTKVMITTGYEYSPSTKTEVVDVLSGETCADLADFPVKVRGAVGANLDGTPVVCGGSNLPTFYQCYKFTNGGWQEFASMKENRSHAAGIVHQNKLHVFGGFNYPGGSKTTELISIDGGVEYGPELPDTIYRHAITSINSTVSILSGGITSISYKSPLTWYFNHENNVFSSGPSLLEPRYFHGSATCVDKVTKAKIPIVTGGFNGANLDSTELLINGQWQSGTIQCQKRQFCFDLLFVQHDHFCLSLLFSFLL